jgi:hypothetical protein
MKLQIAFSEDQTLDLYSFGPGQSRMLRSLRRIAVSLAALGAVAVFAPLMCAQSPQPSGPRDATGATASAAPATTGALSHDLSGVWMQYSAKNSQGQPVLGGIDQETRPPLTPWGQAKLDATVPFAGPRAHPGKENNPSLRCVPEAVPKSLVLPNPFEIVQIPGRVFMFFEEFHLWRTIWADGRPLPTDPDPSYLGYSVGKWEGDTFVVDTIGFNDIPWVDSYGDPRSEKMHLTERYRRLDHDRLELQIIMDDPKSYNGTWTSAPRLYKFEAGWELGEFFCVADQDAAYDEAIRKRAGDATEPKAK